MSQKYKVFFNNNTLFISKKRLNEISFYETFKNPSKEELKEIIYILLNGSGKKNYLITCADVAKTWADFKSFFEVRKAAGGLVINEDNKKLFIKRRGFWDLPKGHLEKNEKNREAALREVSEECGISGLTISRKLIKTYHTYILSSKIILKPTKWYLMKYTGNEKLVPQKKESITHAVWADKIMETEFIENSFSSIIDVLKATNDSDFVF